MLNFFKRLDHFMFVKKISDNRMTLQCGISNGLIGKARNRGSLSQLNISKILLRYDDLNANWLMTGHGDMFLNPDSEKETNHKKNIVNKVTQIVNSKIENIDFLFFNEDDSMLPTIARGDVLLGKTLQVEDIFFQKNNIYIAQTNQETLIRRIKKSDNKDFLILYTDNEKFDSLEINMSQIKTIAILKNSIKFLV